MKLSMYSYVKEFGSDTIVYNSKNGCVQIINSKEYDDNPLGLDKAFYVDESEDEYSDVKNKQEAYLASKKDYMRFTLFPTLRCNANCCYCYENSIERLPMNKYIVEQTLRYIKQKCDGYKKLSIYWFGGEPLVEKSKIDYITTDLLHFCEQNDISYRASIATNASLITDDEYIDKMIQKWKIEKVELAFDGSHEEHNRTKNYNDKKFDAFYHNFYIIERMLKKGIKVQVRLNCREDNFVGLMDVLGQLQDKFGNFNNFKVYVGIIAYEDILLDEGMNTIKSNSYGKIMIEFFQRLDVCGKFNLSMLPLKPKRNNCYATNFNSLVISPTGLVTKCQACPELEEYSIDSVVDKSNVNVFSEWKNPYIDSCKTCLLFPLCLGGCTSDKIAKGIKPCRRELYYFDELIEYLYIFMKKENLLFYKW